jgi:hypothetical protein
VQKIHRDEGIALDVIGRIRKVEHHRVVAARTQILEQILLVQKRVELIPVHRIVDVEAFQHDGRARELRVLVGQINEGAAGGGAAVVGLRARERDGVVGSGRDQRAHFEVKRSLGLIRAQAHSVLTFARVVHVDTLIPRHVAISPAVTKIDRHSRSARITRERRRIEYECHIASPIRVVAHRRGNERTPRLDGTGLEHKLSVLNARCAGLFGGVGDAVVADIN